MEKTVNTAWYAKKCALGTLVCCGTELVLLMLASALILRGAISEEMANGAVLVCAAVAAFLGCMIGARKTSKRAMMTAGCAATLLLAAVEEPDEASLIVGVKGGRVIGVQHTFFLQKSVV